MTSGEMAKAIRELPQNLVLRPGSHSGPKDGFCVMEAVNPEQPADATSWHERFAKKPNPASDEFEVVFDGSRGQSITSWPTT